MGYFDKFNSKGIPFMDNADKGDMHDIVGETVHIEDFGFIRSDEGGDYGVISLREKPDTFYFCNQVITDMLHQVIEENPGKTNLQFTIVDKSNDVKIKLSSKKYRIATTPALMEFIQRNELNYFINI